MLRHLFAFLCFPLFGCATPGMTLSWQVTFPPTQLGSSLIHPVTTLPQTTYMIETPAQVPLTQRQYQLVQPPPSIPIATPPAPAPVRLPMPKESAPCQSPCSD